MKRTKLDIIPNKALRVICMKKIALISFILSTAFPLLLKAQDPVTKTDPSQEERLFEMKQDASGLFRHNPVYFLYGQPNTKVQLSFKYQIVKNFDLFFGYTQVMFWELSKESAPFSDVNFNPELFYRWYLRNGILRGIDFGAFEHKSNGRDLDDSRSFDRTYVTVRTNFQIFKSDFQWDTKLFYIYNQDKTNDDLEYTLGNVELRLAWINVIPSWFKDSMLELKITPGGRFDIKEIKGSRELNFVFHLKNDKFNPAIFMQLYSGYNESLLKFDSDRTGYRIGVSL